MHDVTTLDCSRIAQDLQIRKVQVESVVQLLEEGNTIPFIARFRRERTGGLKEEMIRHVQGRVALLQQLAERKQTILKSIEGQGKLSDELRSAIRGAETSKRLEDLYLPYKPKKKTTGMTARDAGLEPLAMAIWNRDGAVANLVEVLPGFVNPESGLASAADVQTGVHHLLAEMLAEAAEVRATVRSALWESGKICSVKAENWPEGQGLEFKDYFNFSESLRQIPAHRILALNRGEREGALKIRFECNIEPVRQAAFKAAADFGLKSQKANGGSQQTAVSNQQSAVSQQSVTTNQKSEPGVQESAVSQPSHVENENSAGPSGETAAVEVTASAVEPAAASQEATGAVSQPEVSVAILSPALPEPMPLPAEQGEPLCDGSAFRTPHASFLKEVVEDALIRLLIPALEKEIRQELTDEAESHAVTVFAYNLKSLLLQPPMRNRRVLAIDPSRTGCRIAVLDESGNLLEDATIHPHAKKPRERGPKGGQAQAGGAAGTTAADRPATTEDGKPPAPEPAPVVSSAPSEVHSPVAQAPAAEALQVPVTPVAGAGEAPASAEGPAAVGVAEPSLTKPETPSAVSASSRREDAKSKLAELVVKHGVSVVAIGNGAGCRETEELLSELITAQLPDLVYAIVNEAGASVYAVSPIGREEFPNLDTGLRSTISIGRRLQDPLGELVKVDPQNIGVGLYQHDVKRKDLRSTLEGVVESCVNLVGVDVNTASVPLLRYISGLNQMVVRDLVEHRKQHGPYRSREQLLHMPSVGPIRYVQAAGFLRITGGDNPLDGTWIHPENYPLAEKVLAEMGYGADVIFDKGRAEELQARLKALAPVELANKLGAGVIAVQDIIACLARPGSDPREDRPLPIFKKGVLKLEDLKPGMELKGTILNVVDFGAFVDIGLKESGLVHISQMANRYIKSPYDVAAVNDVVSVWVLSVDMERHRVSLTMIKPGTERKQGEKRERPPARGRQGRGPGRGESPGEAPPPRQGDQRPRRRRPETAAPQSAARSTQGQSGPASGAPRDAPPAPQPARSSPPPRPPQPHYHRKPRREAPRPKLSQDALEGKVPLRTFGELSALFAAKKVKREPSEPVAAAQAQVANGLEAAPVEAAAEQKPAGEPAPPD